MFLSKIFSLLFLFFFVVSFYLSVGYYLMSLNFSYLPVGPEKFFFSSLGFSFDFQSATYLAMICLVTSLVSLYSEFYMEHYNQKKFILLMLIFFLSMAILSLSSSLLFLMVGWDGLGLSSICLIMFYPNKNTLYNSILTMFFNRLGDCILILVICILVNSISSIYFLTLNLNLLVLGLILVCSFTKSAQFPLSSWLPAAMSAPTPISAMVHSSTLVTAGIFLVSKLYFYLEVSEIILALSFFSALTFLIGGSLANLEMDFKKIVAFSTMSQISMIMFFCSLGLMTLGMFHMVNHAIFKTLLFCCCGIIFIYRFNDQNSILINNLNKNSLIFVLMFVSIYSMTGLLFSSSFFSKDPSMEILFMFETKIMSVIMIVGSVLTIFYSTKLFSSSMSFFSKSKNSLSKYMFFHFIVGFSIFNLLVGKFILMMFFTENFPCINDFMIYTILMILIFPMLFLINFYSTYNLNMALEIFFMKKFSFSMGYKLLKDSNAKSIFYNDHLFFKTEYFKFELMSMFLNSMMNMKKFFYPILFIFFMFLPNLTG